MSIGRLEKGWIYLLRRAEIAGVLLLKEVGFQDKGKIFLKVPVDLPQVSFCLLGVLLFKYLQQLQVFPESLPLPLGDGHHPQRMLVYPLF